MKAGALPRRPLALLLVPKEEPVSLFAEESRRCSPRSAAKEMLLWRDVNDPHVSLLGMELRRGKGSGAKLMLEWRRSGASCITVLEYVCLFLLMLCVSVVGKVVVWVVVGSVATPAFCKDSSMGDTSGKEYKSYAESLAENMLVLNSCVSDGGCLSGALASTGGAQSRFSLDAFRVDGGCTVLAE